MKKVTTIAIVAGGTLDAALLGRIKTYSHIVGVDRGAWWLLAHGVIPDIAIGDFDSVTKRELAHIKKTVPVVSQYPTEKDATDLELAAAYAIEQKAKEVWMFGALGSRFDHGFAGMQVLLRLSSHNLKGYIVDNFCEISIVVRRVERVEKRPEYRYFSVFPFGGDAIITLKGFKYDVTRRKFKTGSTLGVSNEIQAKEATVQVHRGAALLVRSRD